MKYVSLLKTMCIESLVHVITVFINMMVVMTLMMMRNVETSRLKSRERLPKYESPFIEKLRALIQNSFFFFLPIFFSSSLHPPFFLSFLLVSFPIFLLAQNK